MAAWKDLDFLNDAAKKRNAHLLDERLIPKGNQKTPKKGRGKYNNKITTYKGVKYHSALEAKRAEQLDLLLQAGDVLWWSRQPQFVLYGGVKYIPDFIVQWGNGKVTVEDVKGVETATFKRNKKQLKERFPHLELVVLKKGDF